MSCQALHAIFIVCCLLLDTVCRSSIPFEALIIGPGDDISRITGGSLPPAQPSRTFVSHINSQSLRVPSGQGKDD